MKRNSQVDNLVELSKWNAAASDQTRVDTALLGLARSCAHLGMENFIYSCALDLAMVFRARYAVVSLFEDRRQTCLRTLAVWAGDGFAENYTHAVKGTLFEDIVRRTRDRQLSGAQALYPYDALLTALGVNSYYGVPLTGTAGNVIGVVCVMDTKPLVINEVTAPLPEVFATRLVLEIERQKASDKMHRLNKALERRLADRTAELQRVNHEMESFCNSIVHDLHAPLRSIKSFAALLEEEYGRQLVDPAKHYLKRIVASSRRMGGLIDSMLALFDIAHIDPQHTRVDLSQLAAEVDAELRESFPGRSVEVDIQPGIFVWGDRHLLRIALSNLLGNAWKFTRDVATARIEVGAQRHAASVEFYVADNGVGFDMAYAERLFRIFSRLHGDEAFEGAGVGLSIVQRIVTKHGGSIYATSRPNSGATFRVTLNNQDEMSDSGRLMN